MRVWGIVVKERIEYLVEKYGYRLCEYCGKAEGNHELWILGGHHMDGNRNNNTKENCYVCHNLCHSAITDKNIRVSQEDFGQRELFL